MIGLSVNVGRVLLTYRAAQREIYKINSSGLFGLVGKEKAMKELIFTCPEAGYELYEMLGKYFDDVEMINTDNNEMGILDGIKALVEPISKSVEMIGNIIIALINKDSCTICVKNGDKEISFDGRIKDLSSYEVMELLGKVIEG